MAQDKPDFLKALEDEIKRDEVAQQPKVAAVSGQAAPAATPAKAAPAKTSTLLDALLSDARAEADKEIQQHNQKLQEKASGQKRAEEEEERKKRLAYEQLFEEEKRKRLDAIRRKEEEKTRKEQEAKAAEERRILAEAKVVADKKARKTRIFVGYGVIGVLVIAAILVFTGVIPLLSSNKVEGTKRTLKDAGYVPPPPYKGVSYQPAKGQPLFQLGEKAFYPTSDGAGIEVLQAVRTSDFPKQGDTGVEPLASAANVETPKTRTLATDVAKGFKVERGGGGGGGGNNGGISVNVNIFGGP